MLAQYLGTNVDVLLHDLPFVLVELSRAQKNGVWGADLSDVVQQPRHEQLLGGVGAGADAQPGNRGSRKAGRTARVRRLGYIMVRAGFGVG